MKIEKIIDVIMLVLATVLVILSWASTGWAAAAGWIGCVLVQGTVMIVRKSLSEKIELLQMKCDALEEYNRKIDDLADSLKKNLDKTLATATEVNELNLDVIRENEFLFGLVSDMLDDKVTKAEALKKLGDWQEEHPWKEKVIQDVDVTGEISQE